jgi:type II pantothenate kinase
MLVKDIYGESDDYHSLGLPPDIIASTLGKAMYAEEGEERSFTDADIARSLLFMISNDIGQISSLYAMLHNVKTIYFGGFFLRHHPVTMHTLGYSVNYWTKGQVQARFLRHEGYLGAIGAFLKGAHDCHIEENSWNENTYGSSGFVFRQPKMPTSSGHLEVDHLEMDRFETPLRFCPLLRDPTGYVADTVDLMRDSDAREYWLKCFEDSLPKFTERAIESQDHLGEEAKERAAKFSEQYLSRLRQLAVAPWQHGNLSVRLLLDMREHCLEEFDFHDPYLKQKQSENDEAFALLPKLLDKLDTLAWEEREIELAYGMLAGNVFDWGAKEVALIMEKEGLNFDHAKRLIGPRPWLMDSLDQWVERIRTGPAHRCAAIFIDNSGADVVLGILPFVVAMLRRGTQVLLCANNKPVLNDVTFAELSTVIMQRAAAVCDVIDAALKSKQLECLDSGQSSPCLDLAKLSKSVVDAMLEKGVDLIVLEGMGRAVHTNLYTKFQCECLKAAVLKNRWLANRLGGDMYAVIFHYEDKPSQSKAN